MDFSLSESLNLAPETVRFLKELLIVLGIGLLTGLEREYAKSKETDGEGFELFAGIRTFPLVAIIGYLAMYLSATTSAWIYPIGLGAVAVFALVAYYLANLSRRTGATTEFALIAVFLLSGLVYLQEYLVASFLALLLTALLTLKVNLHKVASALSKRDMLSILLFAVITALILPLLPNVDLGPYGVFNPFKIWLIVSIFISLNFVAYFLHKFIDTHYSIIATGVLGGFASSTATAWYFSRLGGKSQEGGMAHVAAIVLASSIMFPRLLVWLVLLSPALLAMLWVPVLLLGLLGLGIGIYFGKRSLANDAVKGRAIENPINLKDAGIFAILYVVILLLVGFAEEHLGSQGVYIASAISGLTDVDAITISMANYAGQSITTSVAAVAVIIAAFANTLVKYVLCLAFGNKHMRRYASVAFVPLFVAVIGYILYLMS